MPIFCYMGINMRREIEGLEAQQIIQVWLTIDPIVIRGIKWTWEE